ncbi:MAG: GNAT family N-acetyltransferase [Pseudomonadota bacterium]
MLAESIKKAGYRGALFPTLEIRAACPVDAGAACEILRRSITECCHQDHRDDPRILARWLDNKTPGTVASWFASAGNYSLVASAATGILGVALLTRTGRIGLCYVKPELRFAGIGEALLSSMESRAEEWQLPFIRVDSTVTARDFYLRRGYLAGGTSAARSGIQAVSLWKYLDTNFSRSFGAQGRVKPPCLCALACR